MNKHFDDYYDDDEEDLPPSKSQIKREMLALQELGKQLLKLNAKMLEGFPLTEELSEALADYKRFKKNEAKRRQLQLIGKLMRHEDTDAINAHFEELTQRDKALTHRQHQLEETRDLLLGEKHKEAFSKLVADYPETEIQRVRQLIRAAQKELKENKPPSSSRKLFRYLRDLMAE